ncbi:hypothetical protein HDU93_001428, partial [Gonapodya sp. JEL0774]
MLPAQGQRASHVIRGARGFARGRGFAGRGGGGGRGGGVRQARSAPPMKESPFYHDQPPVPNFDHPDGEDVDDTASISSAGTSPATLNTSHLSDVSFSSLAGKIDRRLLQSIPFDQMTKVQAATVNDILAGKDVLAQAKTGTGKTVAFLLPSIQKLLAGTLPPKGMVSVLVLSPTRELALQIEKETKMLMGKLDGMLATQHCIGGTN